MRGVASLLGGILAILLILPSTLDAQTQTQITARGAQISIGGRLHAQYKTSSVEAENAEFFLRRARILLDVTVNEYWSARLQPELSGGELSLQDAYVSFNLTPDFQITAGQFKQAFDLFELASATRLSIIERDGRVDGAGSCGGVDGVCTYSRLTEKLAFAGRDQGVRLTLGSGPLEVTATVTNGTGINTSDENDGKSFAGRATWEFGEALTVGGGLTLHDHPVGAETRYAEAWGADVEFGSWASGPHLQAAIARGDNWRVDDETSFSTWQVVGSWFFPASGALSGVEPLLRISQGDPDTGLDDDGGAVWTPGLMLYVTGRNKFGFNVDLYSPETGDRETSFKFQSFLYF